MEIAKEKWVKPIKKNRKRHWTEGIELPNQEKQNAWRKRNLEILGNIGNGHN